MSRCQRIERVEITERSGEKVFGRYETRQNSDDRDLLSWIDDKEYPLRRLNDHTEVLQRKGVINF